MQKHAKNQKNKQAILQCTHSRRNRKYLKFYEKKTTALIKLKYSFGYKNKEENLFKLQSLLIDRYFNKHIIYLRIKLIIIILILLYYLFKNIN